MLLSFGHAVMRLAGRAFPLPLPWLLFLLLLVAAGPACKGNPRTPCGAEAGEGDSTVCQNGESCLWLNLGNDSGYFCAVVCGPGNSCPSIRTCKIGGASGCATCQSLINVCE